MFEDEGCAVRPEYQERFERLPKEYSHLYLAIEHELTAVICIEDLLRKEAANMIKALKKEGIQKAVMMTGDSEKTAAAAAGIAISDSAELAREIADITVTAEDLRELVTLKCLADRMTKRIRENYHQIIGMNAGLILLGVAGVLQPTASALLHNISTLLICTESNTGKVSGNVVI